MFELIWALYFEDYCNISRRQSEIDKQKIGFPTPFIIELWTGKIDGTLIFDRVVYFKSGQEVTFCIQSVLWRLVGIVGDWIFDLVRWLGQLAWPHTWSYGCLNSRYIGRAGMSRHVRLSIIIGDTREIKGEMPSETKYSVNWKDRGEDSPAEISEIMRKFRATIGSWESQISEITEIERCSRADTRFTFKALVVVEKARRVGIPFLIGMRAALITVSLLTIVQTRSVPEKRELVTVVSGYGR